MEYLTIGQMAKTNHVSEQTLRLYDKQGLLCPSQRGNENGYRYYDIRQSARLDMIQYLKSMGLSLKDIRLQLAKDNLDEIVTLLQERSGAIQTQLLHLQRQQHAVERTIHSFERYRSAPPDGCILLEHLEKRQMYCIDSKINFYDYGLDMYEIILRELKESLMENDFSPLCFCNVGSILRKENLLAKQFLSTEVFVFVEDSTFPIPQLQLIPAGNYLCVYCDSFEKEKDYARRLLREIAEKNYEICGDYICEVIADLPVVESTNRGMFLRLQVPISFR
ncbi:MAG: MerR family transcriptional regulator [Oscillospiraceae bacterium]